MNSAPPLPPEEKLDKQTDEDVLRENRNPPAPAVETKSAQNPSRPGWRFEGNQLFRFLIAGGLNTAFSLIIYWLLLFFVSPQISYAISYCGGILLSYILSTRFVFKVNHSTGRLIAFPMIYVAGYATGALVLQLSIAYLPSGEIIGPILAAIFSIPVTFLISRWIMRTGRHGSSS